TRRAQEHHPFPYTTLFRSGSESPKTFPPGVIGQPSQLGKDGPLVAPAISFVDVNTGRFGKMELDIDDGEFHSGSCKNLHVLARRSEEHTSELQSREKLVCR